MARELHVSMTGDDTNDGGAATPLKTISAAAAIAQPGDTITVHEGVYRERINPPRGGTSDDRRITYQTAPGEKVTIKGSERLTGWEHVEDSTWRVTLPNTFFGNFNPYADRIHGAWFDAKRPYHTGAVYLNGHWLKEAPRKKDVVTLAVSGDRDDGPEELMNIATVHLQGGPWIPAEQFASASDGVQAVDLPEGKRAVGRMMDGSFLVYEVDCEPDTTKMLVSAASPVAGGIVEVHLDTPEGKLLGQFDIGFTAEWHHFQNYNATIEPVSGPQTICLVFKARPVRPFKSEGDRGYWFAEVDDDSTTIWADFKGKNPNEEFVEFNVRQSVIYPRQEGINYITVRGFTLEQAAAPWVAPTAEQVGLVGTHWSKGWTIENNTIRYSACVGVTLGKYGDEHDHTYDYRGKSIPLAVERGWSKETIGHHVVRNNHIYNCGQGGIQGSLGCSFSTISDNEIHDIRKDHQYGGCETAGIKLHGAVDVVISDNHVYNCEHWGGIWLDWMGQGARVTGNLLHDNSQDLMFEVNHGPHLVDNNIALSGQITEASGGGAFVHNLGIGRIAIWPDLKVRLTPYFKPHSVDIVDSIDVNQDDERFYNNMFVGGNGTVAYDEYDIAIQAAGNVFVSSAKPSKRDRDPVEAEGFDVGIKLQQKDDGWWLEMNVDPAWVEKSKRPLVTTELLGKATVPDAPFENRDGTPYRIDTDYFGAKRSADNPASGPFASTPRPKLRLKVWPKP